MTKNIDLFSFNKAIANLYDLTNIINKSNASANAKKNALRVLAQLMMPFTPHIAEEMWFALGEKGLISQSKWPKVNEALIENDNVTIAVQVNGKKRTLMTFPKSLSKEEIEYLSLIHI